MPTYSHWDIALLQGIQVNRFCALVSFTILYFDYFIVFSTEVERFWKGFTLSWASALFVANRYLSLVASIPILLEYFGDPPEPRCRQLQSFHQYLALLTQGTVAALLLIRTYALYNRSKHILYLMLITCFAGGAVSAWSIMSDGKYVSDADSSLLRLSGCDLSLSNQQGRHISIAWGSMLVFDTLIFALTVAKIIKSDKKIWKGTLFKLMLRDGAIYYGIMVVINIANIVTFVVVVPTARGMCTILTNVISSILISRLMLNLRNPHRHVAPIALVSLREAEPMMVPISLNNGDEDILIIQ